MNNKPMRLSCFLMIAAVAVLPPGSARAATYCGDRFAGKTVHWIVPSAPGGGYDAYSRLIAPFYEKYTGAQVVVENRSGAGGSIGAQKIMQAPADGSTVGILNGPGLMMAAMFETPPPPNPATDFTLLARVSKDRQLWAVSAGSKLQDLRTILEKGQDRSIVFGTRGPGNLSFVDIVVASRILHVKVDIVTGFRGSRDDILAVLRGDVDAVAHSEGSLLDAFESRELVPWLQVTDGPIAGDQRYENVPWLAGPDGLAAWAANKAGRDPHRAAAEADALVELTGAGRLIAAPPTLDEALTRCLRDAVYAALTDHDFIASAAKAGRALNVARGEDIADKLRSIGPQAARFVPALKHAAAEYSK